MCTLGLFDHPRVPPLSPEIRAEKTEEHDWQENREDSRFLRIGRVESDLLRPARCEGWCGLRR